MNSDPREILKKSKGFCRALLAFKWIRSHKTATRGCFTVDRGVVKGGVAVFLHSENLKYSETKHGSSN